MNQKDVCEIVCVCVCVCACVRVRTPVCVFKCFFFFFFYLEKKEMKTSNDTRAGRGHVCKLSPQRNAQPRQRAGGLSAHAQSNQCHLRPTCRRVWGQRWFRSLRLAAWWPGTRDSPEGSPLFNRFITRQVARLTHQCAMLCGLPYMCCSSSVDQ